MNRHTLRVLEFETIRRAVRDRLLSEESVAILKRSRILTDGSELDALKRTVALMKSLLLSTVRFPSPAFPVVSPALARVEKDGVVLDTVELGAIGRFAASVVQLSDYLASAASETGMSEKLSLFPDAPDTGVIAKRIAAVVDPDGTVREREIPELKRLRSVIAAAQQELQKTAQSLVSDESSRRYFSTNVPTQRDGRTVLPVKADYRGKVSGIVHELSSSGSTVFVEPQPLVERNNAVVEAENRYRNELLRILRELSAFCREHISVLTEAVRCVVDIDLIYARARYAIDYGCEEPDLVSGHLRLVEARHPLLGVSAVPIAVEIPSGSKALIITGPNTGGKTVSLKTVGLLSLMHQFGLQVPAASGTELPVFSGIYADIGDEQSIEQNLSTFSGHMRNISRILNHADENSLVLLDELGSGTDPEEGGALAMAILDELLERGPFTIVTTHHGSLKHYGFTNDRALNASVEFHEQSLRPTYHIIPGLPGSSHAIDIARQMGVLRSVTGRARDYLSGAEYDTGRIIRRLTDREQTLHQEREELARSRDRVEQEQAKLADQEAAIADREREIKASRVRELDHWAGEARSRLENLVRELREGEMTREKTQAVKAFISEIDDELRRERESLASGTSRSQTPTSSRGISVSGKHPRSAPHLAPGQEVAVRSSGKRGVIDRKGKGDSWIVQIGVMKLPVSADELVPVEGTRDDTPRVSYRAPSSQASLELDLRGYRLEEAVQAVDHNIDLALLGGLNQFGVIHGMGEGVLQTGIREHLREHPAVSAFAFAAPEDGGFGKTIVSL
jgi:DNA mismatch repair protein MutS2